jgi:N-methylhydantoinase A/oxoprolinase/acetone carboxylase beta subunit
MPEVLCLGLGGGTKVLHNPDGGVTVGPESVGHRLLSDALVFGGITLTTTDVAVAEGKVNIGDATLVNHLKGIDTIQKARQQIK